jgi:AAA+ superfamily predicted ATPase
MNWLAALRALTATHVAVERQRWSERGSATVHDMVDDALAAELPAESIVSATSTARSVIENDARWDHLRCALGVPLIEAEYLSLLGACELDPRLNRVLAYLDDRPGEACPTPALAARLWHWPLGYQPGPMSALARWRIAGPAGESAWQSSSPWTVDADIAAYLAGAPGWQTFRDGASEMSIEAIGAMTCLQPSLLAEMAATAAAVSADGGVGCEVELVGPTGSGRRTLLAQLALGLGRRPVVIDGDQLDAEGRVRALRTTLLLEGLPIWIADDETLVGVDATPGALTFIARNEPASATPRGVVRLSWPMPRTGAADRQRLWAARTEQPPPRVVTDWELSPADIEIAAAGSVAGSAVAAGVIRRRLRTGALDSMTAMDCPYHWDDLIVSDQVTGQLGRLRNQVLLTQQVLDDWEFRRLCPSAAGITALFSGPSGTGKTMAAQVLARSLELDLYRVDLAEVVNKYIGETEKRLAEVFAQCERSNVMVLFDEADALFGQRTRVRDAHDRYANIEIDYLLQRLDTFAGVAVLATNRKGDLDAAFLRRLRVIVDFVAPAAEERLRLWRVALPSRTSTGEPVTAGLNYDWLATNLELTGAEIKSVALAAAFDARQREELIETRHVMDASRRELVKRGSVLRLEHPMAVAT